MPAAPEARRPWPPSPGPSTPPTASDAPCPAAIIRGRDYRPAGPVIVGLDGSTPSRVALGLAFEHAAARNCAVLVVRGSHDDPIDTVAAWREKYPGVSVDHLLITGDPGKVLATLSGRAQLAVVGSRDRGSFTGMFLDPVSRHLLEHADCPVLVAHT